MSTWTHVAAVFRIDGFTVKGSRPSRRDWDRIIGKEIYRPADTFPRDDYEARKEREDWEEYGRHPSRFLPTGSEGSLQRVIWANPNEHCLASYTVTVFGDLRDYDDWLAIKRWFDGVCERVNLRQAVCTCDFGAGVMTWEAS